jgi:hypothetical protein
MEEPEVPIDEVREHIDHHAHHEKDSFISSVAVSTAIIAAFAAICSLLAGDHANEAMISQLRSSDQWAFFQARSIKSQVVGSKIGMFEAVGRPPLPKDVQEVDKYRGEQNDIRKEAERIGKEAEEHLQRHKLLAPAVTMFQIAIAIGAISALTRRRSIWVVSLIFGLIGLGILVFEQFFFVVHIAAHAG